MLDLSMSRAFFLLILAGIFILVIPSAGMSVTADTKPGSGSTSKSGQSDSNSYESVPEIMFEQTDLTYDLGTGTPNSSLETVLSFKNTGKKPLIISKVQPDCSCIETSLSNNTIPVGGSAEIKVILKTGNHRGHLRKGIRLYTNIPQRKIVTVTLEAYVQAVLDFEKQSVYFGKLPLQEVGVSREIKFSGDHLQELSVVHIETTDSFLKARFLPPDLDQPIPRMSVALEKGIKPGYFRGKVIVHVAKPLKTELTLAVQAHIIGKIHVIPERVLFQITDTKPAEPETVTLSNPEKTAFTIVKTEIVADDLLPFLKNPKNQDGPGKIRFLEASADDLEITFQETEQPGQLSLSLTLKRNLQPHEQVRGKLKLIIDDEDQKEIYLPYVAIYHHHKKKPIQSSSE